MYYMYTSILMYILKKTNCILKRSSKKKKKMHFKALTFEALLFFLCFLWSGIDCFNVNLFFFFLLLISYVIKYVNLKKSLTPKKKSTHSYGFQEKIVFILMHIMVLIWICWRPLSDGSGDEDNFLNTTPAPHQNENCLLNQRRASNAALEHEIGYPSNLWSNPSR